MPPFPCSASRFTSACSDDRTHAFTQPSVPVGHERQTRDMLRELGEARGLLTPISPSSLAPILLPFPPSPFLSQHG
ncbi:hypothetical protein CLOP_g9856 [Closterium sp. NIES-67]|nr:hypothetical protein CLOP_g9856 [Closterium sp. NIES-67]